MLRDVKTTIADGGLMGTPTGVGIHAKIGVSPIKSSTPIKITGTMSAKRIQETLGFSPLADAVMDSIENGASTIYCIPLPSSKDGTISTVTKTGGTSTATITVSGKPNNAYKFVIKVITGGVPNNATIAYSIDGGAKFSDELTIPLGGTMAINTTGLTLTFVTGSEESGFIENDTYKFTTTEPTANNESLLAAVESLARMEPAVEYVHIVGASTNAQWASCAVLAEKLATMYHRPLFMVFEAPVKAEEETLSTYVTTLKTARSGCDSKYIQVVATRGIYTRMDGTTQEINTAGIICGLYARAKVQQSIGETRTFQISQSKLMSITPAGIDEYTAELDETGYLTLRKYDGLDGFYVTNAKMFAPEGSDYRYAERIRVTNKAVREVRKVLLLQLQSAIDIAKQESEMQAIAKFAEAPLDAMIDTKEISSARVIIPDNQDILTSETLQIIIRFVPVGYMREIEVNLGMENPLLV